ncbi:hypothetical protein BV898_04697 [Hypsibius exemplaris]|uniref:Uncharacterized protein n=1 Tax=Hypsibius exemplaris TaxID=2072580 RepID=A0A1W0X1Z8_HYPEX|nr:hypothetical protein BV898_04697 [Hypsibius exemplaris]
MNGTVVAVISVRDGDEGGEREGYRCRCRGTERGCSVWRPLVLRLVECLTAGNARGWFNINGDTGMVTTGQALDREVEEVVR